ncbi:hypothetical protein FB451DRAFT_1469730 [Mycena latifolia]|nr:hypothetical protein FB451DRAFT_1469730 [Mycena latifolia]
MSSTYSGAHSQQSLLIFPQTHSRLTVSGSLAVIQQDAQTQHAEILELLEDGLAETDTDSSYSVRLHAVGKDTHDIHRGFQARRTLSNLGDSSGGLSLLPASPKIFHGRESELRGVVNILLGESPRLAILGPGGMGKTSLAMAALHDPDITTKYPNRYFVSCDSAVTINDLVSMTASNLCLEPPSRLAKVVVHHLSSGPPCLLVLDNFETPWEPVDGRAKVEEFLSLLSDVPHVALLITMRGAERPGKVRWTRPFLPPLTPLTPIAARQTFIDIADDIHDDSDIDELISLTDNLPLALNLVANVAGSEGCADGISIILSLSSPRMAASPHAQELLSLVSLLSDGISDIDLIQSKLPIPDIPKVQSHVVDLVPRLVGNLGNLHNVLLHELDFDPVDLTSTVRNIISLNHLRRTDHELHGRFISEAFQAWQFYTLPNPSKAIDEAIEHFRFMSDAKEETRFYNVIAEHAMDRGELTKARDFFHRARSLATKYGDTISQTRALGGLAMAHWFLGDYHEGLRLGAEARRMGAADGNLNGEAVGIRSQAMCCTALGDFKRSVQFLAEGRELVAAAGLSGGDLDHMLMNSAADVHQLKTEYAEARTIQVAIARETSAVFAPVTHAYALVNIAFLDSVTGASADAVSRSLDAATATFNAAHYPRADLLLREGATARARAEYVRLFAALRSIDDELACCCLAKLADPTLALHEDAECAQWAVVFAAFTMRAAARNMLAAHQALRCLGDVLARTGADDDALSVFAVALDGFTRMDVHQSRAECLRGMGEVHLRRGDSPKAVALWTAARPLFERAQQARAVADLDALVASCKPMIHSFQERICSTA